jgi:hypothetical protein
MVQIQVINANLFFRKTIFTELRAARPAWALALRVRDRARIYDARAWAFQRVGLNHARD